MLSDELLGINKVIETYSQSEANELLDQGWKLLNVYTGTFSIDFNDHMNMYVLGRPKELQDLI